MARRPRATLLARVSRATLAMFATLTMFVTVAAPLVVAVDPAGATVPSSFTLEGSGFGHGVGMSQYGAYGQALEGANATAIVGHYYTSTSVAPVNDAQMIRVNLLHAAPAAQVRGEALATGGGNTRVVAGATTLNGTPNQAFTFSVNGSQVTVTSGNSTASAPTVYVYEGSQPMLLNVPGPNDTFDTTGHRYRYGWIEVGVVSGALEVVNVLDLHEEYLRGIAEVPSSWPAEALQSQVIAARTYALRKVAFGERSDCLCHVFDDTRDQVFAGWAKESEPTYGARWVAAVDATSPSNTTGVGVLYNGAPISANYFSSSGGHTENNEDAFGGSPLAYLRSVDDHWSLNSYNPMASWSRSRSQDPLRSAFGLPDVTSVTYPARTVGGAVRTAVATSSTGSTASISGSSLVSRLALPAAWVRKPVIRIAGADRYATSVAVGAEAAPTGAVVVIASGEDAHLVDGLVAAPLAKAESAPLLLATSTGLPSSVAADIDARKPSKAFLVGGSGALGPGVTDALHAHGVTDVEQLGGATRYDTGLAVAHQLGGPRGVAVIASGEAGHLIDALAASGPAAANVAPILLVTHDAVPPPTQQALHDLQVATTVVAGGTDSISDATMSQLPKPTRRSGSDRYVTAVALADWFAPGVGVDTVVVASGADTHLVDSLAGGALARVTVLTDPAVLTGITSDWLAGHPAIAQADVLGGTTAVGPQPFAAVQTAIGG